MLRCLFCFWLHSGCMLPGGHACGKPYIWEEYREMLVQQVCRLHPYSGWRRHEHGALPLLLGNWWWQALCWAVPNVGTESDQQLRERASKHSWYRQKLCPLNQASEVQVFAAMVNAGWLAEVLCRCAALRRRFCSCKKCCCCWKGWPAWSEPDTLDRRLMSPQTKHIAPGVSICTRSAGQMLGSSLVLQCNVGAGLQVNLITVKLFHFVLL